MACNEMAILEQCDLFLEIFSNLQEKQSHYFALECSELLDHTCFCFMQLAKSKICPTTKYGVANNGSQTGLVGH
jgi:hypothetical protein